jgi:hypothetical protein
MSTAERLILKLQYLRLMLMSVYPYHQLCTYFQIALTRETWFSTIRLSDSKPRPILKQQKPIITCKGLDQ